MKLLYPFVHLSRLEVIKVESSGNRQRTETIKTSTWKLLRMGEMTNTHTTKETCLLSLLPLFVVGSLQTSPPLSLSHHAISPSPSRDDLVESGFQS